VKSSIDDPRKVCADVLARLREIDPEPNWQEVPEDEPSSCSFRFEMRADDGRGIVARTQTPGMLRWFGIMAVGSHAAGLEIRTSASRTPQAIALDLCRRLLPKYATAYAEALAQIEAEERDLRSRDAQFAIVAAAVGVEAPIMPHHDPRYTRSFPLPTTDNSETWGRVFTHDTTHVRIEMTLPTERAVQVLAVLYPKTEA